MSSTSMNRRQFVKTAAFTGIGMYVVDPSWARGNRQPSERVNFACIGVGGQGGADTDKFSRLGNIAAICDVDERSLNKAGELYPNAKKYSDFRKMLEECGKSVDAVLVGTPDHTHAVAAAMAMKMGKHCYCEKPLTHNIWEARELTGIARKMKVATQMGNQGSAEDGQRMNIARIRKGAVGTVREVHVWTNRPIWPQGQKRGPEKPVPAHLNWDLWLGPAPERPFADGYHSFTWRGWWDFGTGALGDMACHIFNMPFRALDLRDPISVEAQFAENNKDSYPNWSVIKFEFAATKDRPAIPVYWYDGGKLPSQDLLPGVKFESSGALIIGDKGKLYAPGDAGAGGQLIDGVDVGEVEYPKSPGHYQELVIAIKEGKPAMANFVDHGGPITETILLGNLAVWAGKKVEWDAKKMRAKNAPEVASLIKPEYRKGWSL